MSHSPVRVSCASAVRGACHQSSDCLRIPFDCMILNRLSFRRFSWRGHAVLHLPLVGRVDGVQTLRHDVLEEDRTEGGM